MSRTIREVIQAGKNLYIRVFRKRYRKFPEEERRPKEKVTPESMRKQNEHNSARHLAIVMDLNFSQGDLHNVCTYRGEVPPTREQAKKHLAGYLRKLRTLYRRKGVPFRYIVITHWESQRINHHILLPQDGRGGVTFDEIAACWPHGSSYRQSMYTETLHGLAGYVMKPKKKSRQAEPVKYERSWSGSKNLIRAHDPIIEEVGEEELKSPKIPAGYKIDEASYFEGENPYTGAKYLDFVLVPIRENARYRKRRGAKRGRAAPTGERAWLIEHEGETRGPYAGTLFSYTRE